MAQVEHIAGTTFHGRKDALRNRFTYGIDYVLVDAEAQLTTPRLFARNGGSVMSLHDSDHGGRPKQGRGPVWVREVLADQDLGHLAHRIELLAQPRVLGHVFNPVSFWLIWDDRAALRVVIAEVSNTFGDRHSYLCHRDDLTAIRPDDTLRAAKVFHVSPFQRIAGDYAFRFDISPQRIAIRIDFSDGPDGLVATLTGERHPLTTRRIALALLRRPFGARRVLALIHWQALVLWWKGATYRARPKPPASDVSLPRARKGTDETDQSSGFAVR